MALSRRAFVNSGAMSLGLSSTSIASIARSVAGAPPLRILAWPDELPDQTMAEFTKWTGVQIEATYVSSVQDLNQRMNAGDYQRFDIVTPTIGPSSESRTLLQELGVLQPWDLSKIDTFSIFPSLLKHCIDTWSWDGGPRLLPYAWGTEAIGWRSDKLKIESAELSYGSLWTPEAKGLVTVRPRSSLFGVGLYLDRIGELPSNRLLDAYEDERRLRQIADGILNFVIEHRSWIQQFWQSSGDVSDAFRNGTASIAQTWDTPMIQLKSEGLPISYQAPMEGALTWLDGMSLVKDAQNAELAYAFANFIYRPEINAGFAESTGYNPVVQGVEKYFSSRRARDLVSTFPGDALDHLWIWPPEPPWFGKVWTEYADKFKSA